MSHDSAPKTVKWPFLLGDVLLLGAAGWIAYQGGPLGPWQTVALVVAVAIGAWILIQPFLRDHEAAANLEELDRLKGAAAQINSIEEAADRIGRASQNWQAVQEQSGQTVAAAKALTEQVAKEASLFQQFQQRAGDAEKDMLRLEVEKLRRVEAEWIQVTVRMLDHVFALFAGARRSGQAPLIEQIGNFQAACLDTSRRIGLNPFAAKPGETFDDKAHRTVDGLTPPAGSTVADTLAPGFKFQGQILRPAIVALATHAADATEFVDPETHAETSDALETDELSTREPAEPAPEPERGRDPSMLL